MLQVLAHTTHDLRDAMVTLWSPKPEDLTKPGVMKCQALELIRWDHYTCTLSSATTLTILQWSFYFFIVLQNICLLREFSFDDINYYDIVYIDHTWSFYCSTLSSLICYRTFVPLYHTRLLDIEDLMCFYDIYDKKTQTLSLWDIETLNIY